MATRISGLASGMDIDSMVTTMLKPEQARIDKVSQQKTKSQWLQESYNDVNAKLAKFILDRKTDFGITTSINGTLLNNSAEKLTWLKTASIDNGEIAGVTAIATAATGSFKINVKTLAQNWSAASSSSLPPIADKTDDTLANRFSMGEGSKIDFTIATNKGKLRITSDKNAIAEEDTKLLKLDLNVNSIDDVASMINNAGIGLKSNFDSTSGRFFLQTSSSGTGSTLKISDASTGLGSGVGGFIAGSRNALKLSTETANSQEEVKADTQYMGIDAVLDVGAAKDITQSTNVFSINGVNFSLKKIGTTNVQVATDVNSTCDKIKKFVDEYNNLIEGLATKLNEKYDRSYSPLTDAQRKDMSEDQIKNWEEKAKTGLLYNNTAITSMFYSMRTTISSRVEGMDSKYSTLSSIGINTESYSATSVGRLEIDDSKLKEALMNDPEGVFNLLFKSSGTVEEDDDKQNRQTGVVNQLFDNIVKGMKSIVNIAGVGSNASLYRSVQSNILIDFVTTYSATSSIDKEITIYQKNLVELNSRYEDAQTRYYNRFTIMENAISKSNSQSAWLAQQLGSNA